MLRPSRLSRSQSSRWKVTRGNKVHIEILSARVALYIEEEFILLLQKERKTERKKLHQLKLLGLVIEERR
jgi:hypothetical protein